MNVVAGYAMLPTKATCGRKQLLTAGFVSNPVNGPIGDGGTSQPDAGESGAPASGEGGVSACRGTHKLERLQAYHLEQCRERRLMVQQAVQRWGTER